MPTTLRPSSMQFKKIIFEMNSRCLIGTNLGGSRHYLILDGALLSLSAECDKMKLLQKQKFKCNMTTHRNILESQKQGEPRYYVVGHGRTTYTKSVARVQVIRFSPLLSCIALHSSRMQQAVCQSLSTWSPGSSHGSHNNTIVRADHTRPAAGADSWRTLASRQ